MYPHSFPVWSKPTSYILTPSEHAAAVAEFDARRAETERYLARARRRRNHTRVRELITAALRLEAERITFLSRQDDLKTHSVREDIAA